MMISQAKRTRIIRNRISNGVNDSKQAFVSDHIRYLHVNRLVDIHEQLLDDINEIAILREGEHVLAGKMNDDRYDDEEKYQMYVRYSWIKKDIQDLLI